MDEKLLDTVVEKVVNKIKEQTFIEVEASGRHVHLSRECVEMIFGKGYVLTKAKELSQPSQYACKERVTIMGPKGSISNVVVLGPEREKTQVEISLTDGLILGIKAEIRESGDIEGSSPIIIASDRGAVRLEEGCIVAKRHIHITKKDAEKFNVHDKEIVKAEIFGKRKLIFDDVVVRVNENFKAYMHIDYDEANACGFTKGTLARIIK